MGIKEAHLVVSNLISSFQCGHYLNLIEHDQNVPYSPVRVQNMVYENFAKAKWKRSLGITIWACPPAQLSYDVVVRPEIAWAAPSRYGDYRCVAESSECDPLVCLSSSGYSPLFPSRIARLELPPRLGLLRVITTPAFGTNKTRDWLRLHRFARHPTPGRSNIQFLNSNRTLRFVYTIVLSVDSTNTSQASLRYLRSLHLPLCTGTTSPVSA